MARYVIAVGSNVGDRLAHLQATGEFLRTLHETSAVTGESGATVSDALGTSAHSSFTPSSIWETAPVGPSKYPFMNAVALLHSSLPPEDLLEKLRAFEVSRGRSPEHERWAPRELDLDIISADELVIQTQNLIIPHPEMSARLFVLIPLREIDPDWVHPISGKTVSELIRTAPALEMKRLAMTW